MKSDNGFTLIELLAIIVILAIIAVITIPVILNIVEGSKIGSVKNSAYGYVDAVSNFYYEQSINYSSYEFDNKRYNSSELKDLGVSVSGKQPENNSWVDIIDDEIINGCLQFGDYFVNIEHDFVGEVSKGKCDSVDEWNQTIFPNVLKSSGQTVYYDSNWIKEHPIFYNPIRNLKCNYGETDCMKWYAYSESNGKVNMLLDHNITNEEWADEGVFTNQSMPNELLSVLDEIVINWSDKLIRRDSYSHKWNYDSTDYSLFIDYTGKKARLLSVEEISDIMQDSSWTDDIDVYYFGSGSSNGYLAQNDDEQMKQRSFSWLFDNMHECTFYGCESAQSDVYAYWTITPKSNTADKIWCVSRDGSLDSTESSTSWVGIRPVISVSKSTIY